MKKIVILTAGAILFGSAAVLAQDTIRTQQRRDTTGIRQTQPQQERQRQDQTDLRKREKDQNPGDRLDQDTKGWTTVNSSDIPAGLRTTLSGSQYSGWENATIYRNDKDNGYRVRIGTQNPKTYYFDKNGKAVTKPNQKPDN